MKKLLCFLTFFVGLWSASAVNAYSSIDNLEFLTEEFPPYNFSDEKGELTGISVDLLELVLKKLGSEKNRNDFLILPWARAYSDAQNPSMYNVLFATTRTPSRESLFKWVGPISDTIISVFADESKNYQVNSPEDLKHYLFSAIRGDVGAILLGDMGIPGENILNSANFETMVRQVSFDRTQMFAYEENVTFWLLKKHKITQPKYLPIYTLQSGKQYYAFNISVEDETIDRIQQALDEILANTELVNSIREKYLN